MDISDHRSANETERAVGNWFAAADLVLELDTSDRVRYAAGAALTLTGTDPEALLGVPIADIVAPHDRRRVQELLERVRHYSLVGPAVVALHHAGLVATLGLCCWPHDPNRVFAAVTLSRMPVHRTGVRHHDPESNTLPPDEFARAAAEIVLNESTEAATPSLYCVDIGDSPPPGDSDVTATASAAAALRGISVGGDAVTWLGGGRFVVLADPEVDVLAFVRRTFDDSHARDPDCQPVSIDARGLNRHDMATVIAYVVGRYRDWRGDAPFDVSSLHDAVRRLLEGTLHKRSALGHSVRSRDFQIVFQPIVELTTGQTQHYEVLSRFSHGETPYQTVLFAESAGLIEDLDLAVIQKAIDAIQAAAASGHSVRLAVNVSARSLGSSILMRTLDERLAGLGSLRGNLLLEISETFLIEDLVAAANLLTRFRDEGNPICLDDFGSGVSSFPYLQTLPIDFVKVDGSYIRTMLTDARHAAIIKAMAGLCHDLEIRTIAEMIESEGQADRLRALGIDFGQGWLFGRPVESLSAEAAESEI